MNTWRIVMVLLGASSGWAQVREIKCRLSNQAHLPESLIKTAEEEAAIVLGSAGVYLVWVDCEHPGSCEEALKTGELRVAIRGGAPVSESGHYGVELMGTAFLFPEGQSTYATVFYSEVQRLVRSNSYVGAGQVLGCVIAHEIGHLLFGPQHLDGSVMAGRWGRYELELIARRELRFKRAQNLAQAEGHAKFLPRKVGRFAELPLVGRR